MATVIVPDSLARLFGGMPRRLTVSGETVGVVLAVLDERHPGVADRLCDAGPVIRRHITIFVDGERARLDTPVCEGSEVLVIPAVSGGSGAQPSPPTPLPTLRERGESELEVVPLPEPDREHGALP